MAFRLVGITHPERDPFTPGAVRRPEPHEFPLGRRKQYPNALRKAVSDILGDGPPEVRIFQGERLVAICTREYRNTRGRGGKFSVSCSGEKPSKAMKSTRAARARQR